MNHLNQIKRLGCVFVWCSTAWCITASLPLKPARLDLFDRADNPLMFVTFTYDPVTGENTGRTVYMADSTFVRNTVTSRGGDGKRESDVSYNFNGDTSFVTRYTADDNVTAMTIHDYFGMDQIGGPVRYSDDNLQNVDMRFQGSDERAMSIVYDMDSSGADRVYVLDRDGAIEYYGVFTYLNVPVRRQMTGVGKAVQVRIGNSGASGIGLFLNLHGPAEIKVEILSLSGRKLFTAFYGKFNAGSYVKKIGAGRNDRIPVADGLYVLTASLNGSIVATSRYLHQSTLTGGGR